MAIKNQSALCSINLNYDTTCVSISRNNNFVAVGGKVSLLNSIKFFFS